LFILTIKNEQILNQLMVLLNAIAVKR